MGKLRKALDELKFDIRMKSWNENQGVINQKEYSAYLNSLEDVASKAVELKPEEESNGGASYRSVEDNLTSPETVSAPAAEETMDPDSSAGSPIGGGQTGSFDC